MNATGPTSLELCIAGFVTYLELSGPNNPTVPGSVGGNVVRAWRLLCVAGPWWVVVVGEWGWRERSWGRLLAVSLPGTEDEGASGAGGWPSSRPALQA